MAGNTIACPICGKDLDSETVKELHLDAESVSLIREKTQDGTLMTLLRIGEAAEPLMQSEKLAVEAKVLELFRKMQSENRQMVREIAAAEQEKRSELMKDYEEKQLKVQQELDNDFKEMRQGIGSIKEKIVGTGIGKVGEMATIRALQSAFKEDGFTDKHADEKGTDIVAEVRNEERKPIGKIVISVKYQDRWMGDFIRQIKENKEEERTEWGILVTRAFPSNALNQEACLHDENIFLVKPEYACIAYYGFREAVRVKWEESQKAHTEDEAMRRSQMMLGALQDWIRGEKFQELKKRLDAARRAAEETQKVIKDWQKYSKNKGDEVIDKTETIIREIDDGEDMIVELRENLKQAKASTGRSESD